MAVVAMAAESELAAAGALALSLDASSKFFFFFLGLGGRLWRAKIADTDGFGLVVFSSYGEGTSAGDLFVRINGSGILNVSESLSPAPVALAGPGFGDSV